MKNTARPLSLLISLGLCAIALSTVTTAQSCAGPAASVDAQALPFSSTGASVPAAPAITFLDSDDIACQRSRHVC